MAPPRSPDGPRTHHLLRVDLEEGVYLADVGFGGHLLAGPLRLERDVEQANTGKRRSPDRRGSGLHPSGPLPRGWQDLYWFTLEPPLPIDYEVGELVHLDQSRFALSR